MTKPKNPRWGYGDGGTVPEPTPLAEKIAKRRRVIIARFLADAYTVAQIASMLPAILAKEFPEAYPTPKESPNV